MATPAAGEFVISQGDSLPVMRIPIPANSEGELIDLTDCTVTFLGRIADTRVYPPPIIRLVESYAAETHDFGGTIGEVAVTAVYVHLTANDTKAIAVPTKQSYVEMEGELEVVDGDGEILTVPSIGYLTWWVRDDIGDGA